jgi:MFS superfamily sulfate permease-like transporter
VSTTTDTATRAKRRLPIFQGIVPIDRTRVPLDIAAGVTLAALGIPEVMGYTSIAGMPVIAGLYTILIPIAVFAVLGSSRHLVVGADSASAAILDVDYWGGETIKQAYNELRARGVRLVISEASDSVRAELDRHGATALLGTDAYYPTMVEAVAAFEHQPPN